LGSEWPKAKLGFCQPEKMIGVVFEIMVQGTIHFKTLNGQLNVVLGHPKGEQAL
jgi:hypothetical protein